jgi:hypothetical protein
MVDVLYILTWNRTMKAVVIFLSGRREVKTRDGESEPDYGTL